MNFAMKMSHILLSFSCHKPLYFRCILQNIFERFEDLFEDLKICFMAKKKKKKNNNKKKILQVKFPGFITFT